MPIQTGARQSLDIWCGAWLLFSNHLYPSTSPDANGCLTVRNRISSDLTHKQEVARGAGQMRPGLGMGRDAYGDGGVRHDSANMSAHDLSPLPLIPSLAWSNIL